MENITGLIAAPFAPLNSNGELNENLISTYADHLRRNKISGVFVNGTNGECFELTLDERKCILESWSRYNEKDFKVIAHVAHSNIDATCELAEHACDHDAFAIGIMMPPDSSAMTLDDISTRLAKVSNVIGDTALYYYHMPPRTGLKFSVLEILEHMGSRLQNLAGVKFTDYNLMDFNLSMELQDGRFDMLFGRDEMLLDALSYGAKGAVGSTYSFLPHLYNDIVSMYRGGDITEARKLQVRAMEIINSFAGLPKISPIAAQKYILKQVGVDCGPTRDKALRLDSDDENLLEERLKESGFYEMKVSQ